jgi:hypothetical protein
MKMKKFEPLKVNNQDRLFEITVDDVTFICTIEKSMGNEVYYAYNSDDIAITALKHADIVDLLSSGTLYRDDYIIKVR